MNSESMMRKVEGFLLIHGPKDVHVLTQHFTSMSPSAASRTRQSVRQTAVKNHSFRAADVMITQLTAKTQAQADQGNNSRKRQAEVNNRGRPEKTRLEHVHRWS